MITESELFDRLRALLKAGWMDVPADKGYGGTGGAGVLLEELLGVRGGNLDIPDAGRWEIKFHTKNALLTLFHLEGEPRGHMHHMVREFGWRDKLGRLSFRHTIWGRSSKGFYVANEGNRITVRHDKVSDMVWPYWTHDKLINAFAAKLRRLILVEGKRRRGQVRYDTAWAYESPQPTLFAGAVERGIVAIDFDARTQNGRGLRNHGTKFRIRVKDLRLIYSQQNRVKDPAALGLADSKRGTLD